MKINNKDSIFILLLEEHKATLVCVPGTRLEKPKWKGAYLISIWYRRPVGIIKVKYRLFFLSMFTFLEIFCDFSTQDSRYTGVKRIADWSLHNNNCTWSQSMMTSTCIIFWTNQVLAAMGKKKVKGDHLISSSVRS